jgi:hypothetical protein
MSAARLRVEDLTPKDRATVERLIDDALGFGIDYDVAETIAMAAIPYAADAAFWVRLYQVIMHHSPDLVADPEMMRHNHH